MRAAQPLAAGVAPVRNAKTPTANQAFWRFFNHPKITLPALVQPLRKLARERLAGAPFAILVPDWSKPSCLGHDSKADRTRLTHDKDVGYELYCELSIDPHNGLPVAPVEVETETADGLLSTRQAGFQEKVPCHVDRIVGTMRAEESWNLPVKCLHTIDREVDSIGHFRGWYSAVFHLPVRSDDRSVRLGRQTIKFSRIDITNMVERRYVHAGKAEYEGRPAELWVSETAMVMHRPAQPRIDVNQKYVTGKPLPVPFVTAQVRDPGGRVPATWCLMTNTPSDWPDAAGIAGACYRRWRIDIFFKLLKGNGLQLED